MANKALKSLTFPGLNDVYKIPQEADEYSTSATYAVGDYCIKDGVLYRCTTAITTAEAWTAGHWTATQLADEVTSQSEKIDDITNHILDDAVTLEIFQGIIDSADGHIVTNNQTLSKKRLMTSAVSGSTKYFVQPPANIGYMPLYWDENGTYKPYESPQYIYKPTFISVSNPNYSVCFNMRNTSDTNLTPSSATGFSVKADLSESILQSSVSPDTQFGWESGAVATAPSGNVKMGDEVASDARMRTGYIRVFGGATIETTNIANGGITPIFFDKIKRAVVAPSPTAYIHSYTVEPGKYEYMRLMFKLSNASTALTVADAISNVSIKCGVNQYNEEYLKGKTLIFTGDSIPHGQTMDGDVPVPYPQMVALKLGMTLKNYSIGGSTIAQNEDYGGAFETVAEFNAATKDTSKLYDVISGQTYTTYKYNGGSWGTTSDVTRTPICSRISFMDDGDVVVVAGGTNDFQYSWTSIGTMASRDNTTFYGALHNICLGLLEKYFKKQIIFCTPIKRAQSPYTSQTDQNENGLTLKQYCEIIKEVCDFYSIPVIDLYGDSGLNPEIGSQSTLFDSVKTHPLQAGHNILGYVVANRLKAICGLTV